MNELALFNRLFDGGDFFVKPFEAAVPSVDVKEKRTRTCSTWICPARRRTTWS